MQCSVMSITQHSLELLKRNWNTKTDAMPQNKQINKQNKTSKNKTNTRKWVSTLRSELRDSSRKSLVIFAIIREILMERD